MIFWTVDQPVHLVKDVNGTDQLPADAQPFEHGKHPRHIANGKFVPRSDIHQAMIRIHNGNQSRATLPKPVVPDHPATPTRHT